MRKHLLSYVFCLLLLLSATVLAQKPSLSGPNEVDGLELPDVVLVKPEKGFTRVQAKTEGTVKWLVISNPEIEYLLDQDGKTIILGSLDSQTQVNIFAVANIKGKTTEFAQTKVVFKKEAVKKQETTAEKLDYKIRW